MARPPRAATAEEPTSSLVKMVREGEEPTTADVHPDEVENYRLGGWTEA